MKTLFTCLVLALLTSGLSAKQVGPDVASKVASNFVSGYSTTVYGLRNAEDIQLVYTAINTSGTSLRSTGVPLFYVFNVSNDNGFVIISGDDNISPVLAYAEQGAFRVEGMPGNLRGWLQSYQEQIVWAIENGYSATGEIVGEWASLSEGNVPKTAVKKELTTAKWNQDDPFNLLCPLYTGKRTVTGCVATSMGILMKYHQWPAKGTGSNSYTTSTHKLPVSVGFNTTYNWNNMPNKYNASTWTQAEKTEVATLLYHAGASVNMNYGLEESAAYTFEAVDAFVDNFGYDKGMYLAFSELYTTAEWHALLQGELNANRPVFYSGITSKNEGHQFIFDGYNDNNYYRVNWGWGGGGDGYYRLTALDPQASGSTSQNNVGFRLGQDALIGLQKAQSGSTFNHEIYFIDQREWGLPQFHRNVGLSMEVAEIQRNQPFKLHFSYLLDYGIRDFKGCWGFFVVDKNGNRKASVATFDDELNGNRAMATPTEGITLVVTSEVAEGDKLQLFYASDLVTWKPVRGRPGVTLALPIKSSSSANEPQVESPTTILVSPTVVSSSVSIQTTDNKGLKSIAIYDFSGRQVKRLNYENNETSISVPMNDVQAGIYIIVIETDRGIEKHKIVKQ